jgi:hypothetical protein
MVSKRDAIEWMGGKWKKIFFQGVRIPIFHGMLPYFGAL